MSIESRSRQYGRVFDHWQMRDFLGQGSGGKSAVFRLIHCDSSSVQSALKVISLIEERGSPDQMTPARRAEYEAMRQRCKENAEQEVLLMNGLQGRTNVVDYLDHAFVDWVDETSFGCDMLIRMELLRDLRSQIQTGRPFSQADVLKVGRDICTALSLCHNKTILHRDIKPENIFFNEDGNYKLGDFGVSRILGSSPLSMASTGIGTPQYWAPEQITGNYDQRVDIYSLGLVLYELSNGGRLPFAASSYVTDREVQQRMMGTPLPPPRYASPALAAVILCACSHDPNTRFQNAEAFLAALNGVSAIAAVQPAAAPPTPPVPPVHYGSAFHTPVRDLPSSPPPPSAPEKPRRSGLVTGLILFAVALVVFLGVLLGASLLSDQEEPRDQRPALSDRDEDRQGPDLPAEPTSPEEPETPVQPELSPEEQRWQQITTEYEALVASGDLLGAYQYLKAQAAEGVTPELEALLAQALTAYEAAVLTEATELAAQHHYRQAIYALDQAAKEEPLPTFLEGAAEYRLAFGVYGGSALAAGKYNSFLLHSSGRVSAWGENAYKELNSRNWADVVYLTAGDRHVVGLTTGGTLISAGDNAQGQRDIGGWRNIVAVSAGDTHTVALTADGGLLAAGYNLENQCDMTTLQRSAGTQQIVSVAAGYGHTLALLADGTVVAVGRNDNGECNVAGWTDIAAIYAGTEFSAGLRTDGTVVATGLNTDQWGLDTWTDVVALSCGDYYLTGLREDGTALAVASQHERYFERGQLDVSGWTGIVALAAGHDHTMGLTADGYVVCTGANGYGQSDCHNAVRN